MVDNSLISVVIPTYNAERFVEQCYANLAIQEYKNIEMFFVNDGSTDNTLGLLRQIGSSDPRVVVIDKPNGGPASARNLGLDRINGKYLAFIDVDDYIAPRYLLRLRESIGDADICICKYQKVSGENSICPPFPDKQVCLSGREAVKFIFDDKMHTVMISPWCKLFRTDYINQYHFVDGRKCEDEEWSYRVIYNADKISFIPDVLYDYKVIDGSDSHTLSFQRLYDSALNCCERMEFFKNKEKEKEYYALASFSFYDVISSLMYFYKRDTEKMKLLTDLNKRNKIPILDMFTNNPIRTIKIMLKYIRSKLLLKKKDVNK